ncbi:MAG: hypothetical protein HUJ73_00395, partial [Eubacterium sp.]|nr:hypothetical protein [Eubacterium sp.]
MSAFSKDILRTIKGGFKRILAIMLVTAVGIAMMTALRAACSDLSVSADRFFDAQKLHDIYIQSTLGLTDEDVAALEETEGVSSVAGFFSKTVHTEVNGSRKSAEMRTVSDTGIDAPYVSEGRLPQAADEIAVTSFYLFESGKKIGDTVTIQEDVKKSDNGTEETAAENDTDEISSEDSTNGSASENTDPENENKTAASVKEDKNKSTEKKEKSTDAEKEDGLNVEEVSLDDVGAEIEEEEETPDFPVTTYTITASVVDPCDINNREGGTKFRASAMDSYVFFVLPEAVDNDIYTGIGVILEGTADMFCFDQEYRDLVDEKTAVMVDTLKEAREEARTRSVKDEANGKIDDAEKTMRDAFDDAETQFSDARTELDDGRKKLKDAEKELKKESADGQKEIDDGREQIESGYAEIDANLITLYNSQLQVNDGLAQLEQGAATIAEQEQQLSDGEAELARAKEQLPSEEEIAENLKNIEAGMQELQSLRESTEAQIASLEAEKAGYEAQLADVEAQLAILIGSGLQDEETLAMIAQLEAAAAGLNEAISGYAAGIEEANAGLAEIDTNIVTLEGQKALLDEASAGWAVIHEKEAELSAGREQLEAGKAEIETNRASLQAAQAQINSGYAQIEEARQKLADSEKELEDGQKELTEKVADAEKEIADGWSDLEEGEEKYASNWDEYQIKKKDAEEKIEDARKEVDELDPAKWYFFNRRNLSGFVNIESDTGAISSLGIAFSVIFLAVAILVCLTTVNRMIEEDRGLTGTYKALGFTDAEIMRKYVLYMLVA